MKKICFYLISFLALTSCTRVIRSDSGHSFSNNITTEKEKIQWNEMLEQEPMMYLAYIYSETCHYCQKLDPKIKLVLQIPDRKIYFIEFHKDIPVSGKRGSFNGENDINKVYILGTPTLFLIEENTIAEMFAGYYEVESYIDILI